MNAIINALTGALLVFTANSAAPAVKDCNRTVAVGPQYCAAANPAHDRAAKKGGSGATGGQTGGQTGSGDHDDNGKGNGGEDNGRGK